jgi:glucose-6-phosphate isomerase
MKIEFFNCPEAKTIDSITLPEAPTFLSYRPNFGAIEKLAEEYAHYKNLIVIGHGGSVSSFYGMYHALREQSTKQVYVLSTVDPDYITELKNSLSPEDTLVIAISKSGETVTQIEALLHFTEFPLVCVTGVAGPLAELGEKLSAKLVLHMPISGRFTGLTEVALLPAAICGFDIQAMWDSAKKQYDLFAKDNFAFQAASIAFQLEDKGFVDFFMPIYDSHLFPMANLIIQLCHESFGKDGKGQTYFAHHAPESQHHTNQRFFGGRKNIAGWFLSSEKPLHDIMTVVPTTAKEVPLKEKTLGMLDGIPLSVALRAERDATIEDARLNNIPVIAQTVDQRTAGEVGNLIAFWQLYAVYSSVLRNVNPFDQPQVENSKNISFSKRLQYKGLL